MARTERRRPLRGVGFRELDDRFGSKPDHHGSTRGSARPDSLRLPFSASLRLIVVLNERLLEVMGDNVTQEQAFAHANDVLKNVVGGISDIIHPRRR